MSFKDEKPPQSPKLNAPVWGSDPKAFCYRTARGTAHIFYARIQKETEEFLYHLLRQNDSFQQGILKEEPQNACAEVAEEDTSLTKLKYLVMIHTACSQITNLLVNSS